MSDQPKEEKKPVDYLQAAKDNCNTVTYLNTGAAQRSIACSLVFIGEQLERIANAAAEGKFEYDVKFNVDNLVEIMTKVKEL